jgi:S-DNA-T family DNA segregation ATPase FtsK/SpoIIIE
MSAASKPHGANNSHSTESDWDETITLIVMALAKGLAVLAWWSVLFPMISIPTIASVWVGFRYGPVFGLILAAMSGLALAAWSQLSPVTFHDWLTARCGPGGGAGRSIGTAGPRSAPCTG